MKDAPMGKYSPEPKSVARRSSGSNTTPRPDGVRHGATGTKDKPFAARVAPKSTLGDKERPVIKEPTRKEPPARRGSAGSSKFTAKVVK